MLPHTLPQMAIQWKKDQTNVKPYIESTVKEKLRILFKFAQNHPRVKQLHKLSAKISNTFEKLEILYC